MTKEYKTLTRKRRPTHPGEMLEEVLDINGVSISEAARRLHVSRQTLHRLIACERALTPEMALMLSKFCGSTPEFWLRLQQACDLWEAERSIQSELKLVQPIAKPHKMPILKDTSIKELERHF